MVEDLEIKRKLFERIAPVPETGRDFGVEHQRLSIARMSEVLPAELKSRFLVLHFFNPVRYMRLLELAKAPETESLGHDAHGSVRRVLGQGRDRRQGHAQLRGQPHRRVLDEC